MSSVRRVPTPNYPNFPAEEIEARCRRVRDVMAADGIDLLLLTERENVVYAIKQNLRQIERRRAYDEQRDWVDPYPDLETPCPQTRTYLSGGLKFWIAVGVLLVVGAILLVVRVWAIPALQSRGADAGIAGEATLAALQTQQALTPRPTATGAAACRRSRADQAQ